jgi:hypothetical protein
VGLIDGDVFHYNGRPAGKVEGLMVTREDKAGPLIRFRLVPKKAP